MSGTLHVTSGDVAGDALSQSGIPGEVFVWHDILYDGPRNNGWPEEETLEARADFLVEATAGGLERDRVLGTLRGQYEKLSRGGEHERIVLWFDACLFDQAMLAHILTCLARRGIRYAELLCVDAFPGIVPFNGLGQLSPTQMASVYDQRRLVTEAQFRFADSVDRAFALQDLDLLKTLSGEQAAPLPWIPAAVARWLQERPDPETGRGRLEQLALDAIREGCELPGEIFRAVAAADTPPQYWGDITLWAKINALAECDPPLVQIEGPTPRLPQWEGVADLQQFRVKSMWSGAGRPGAR